MRPGLAGIRPKPGPRLKVAEEGDLVSGEGEQPKSASPAGHPTPAGTSEGDLPLLPRRLAESLHLPARLRIIDPQFSRHSHRYLIQAGLAAMGMLAILVFVDSLSDAALAAGAERAPAYPELSGLIRLGCRAAIKISERV